MKKCLIMLLTAALFVVAGCKKDNDNDKKMTFTSDLGGGAKTEINDHAMKWTTGDDIIINGETFACEVKEGGDRAEFTGKVVASPYHAYYPTSIWNEGTLTLPSTQYYDVNNLSRVSPMYARSENTTLTFHNICALVKLDLKGIGTVKTITASSDQSLSGEFNIAGNETNGYYADVPHLRDGTATVTLDCGQGVALAGTSKPFYIALPKGEYTNLKFAVSDGTITKEVTMDENNLFAGKLYEIEKEVELVADVPVESVSVSPITLSLEVGATQQLTATVLPENAANKNVTWSSDNTSVATVAADGTVTAVAAGTANITVTTEDGGKTATCVVTVPATGALPGKFTVNSSGKQVYFSKGNLWYGPEEQGATATWNFEEKQYYFRQVNGLRNDAPHLYGNPTVTPVGTRGFFWFSQDATKASVVRSSEPAIGNNDVLFTNKPGAPTEANPNFTANGVTGKWRTLTGNPETGSKGEWEYIVKERTVNYHHYAYVKVDGEAGLLLFPDVFTWPSVNDVDLPAPTVFDKASSTCNGLDYTPAQFVYLENAGCVFLPTPGYIPGYTKDYINNADKYAYYLSSNTKSNDTDIYYLKVYTSANIEKTTSLATCYWMSLRLVTDVPSTNN